MEEALKQLPVTIFHHFSFVSILVLMEEALKHYLFYRVESAVFVSILVLMEEALKQEISGKENIQNTRFNPCFNGRST